MMMDERDQKDRELKESIASMEANVNENLILQKENDELKVEINIRKEEEEKQRLYFENIKCKVKIKEKG